jgi:protein-disulfide isomerase
MPTLFDPMPAQPPVRTRRIPAILMTAAFLIFTAAAAPAQFSQPDPATPIKDASALKPPPGASVAIVEFLDLQCPVCATTNPILEAAAAKYNIPLVRHDYLIPYHNWSRIAAINARWFDSRSRKLGSEYRDQVFANQSMIYNPFLLREFTQRFAQDHKITLPDSLDPSGQIANDVEADNQLGKRTGIVHTPTVFVVTAGGKGAPFVEVLHPDQDLYTTIDQAIADTPATKPAKPAQSKTAHK